MLGQLILVAALLSGAGLMAITFPHQLLESLTFKIRETMTDTIMSVVLWIYFTATLSITVNLIARML